MTNEHPPEAVVGIQLFSMAMLVSQPDATEADARSAEAFCPISILSAQRISFLVQAE